MVIMTREIMYTRYLIIVIWYAIVTSNGQSEATCIRSIDGENMKFVCSSSKKVDKFDIDHLSNFTLDRIKKFQVIGTGIRGPLTFIPDNICRLTQLKYLDLSNNQISNGVLNSSLSCLSQLETLDLSNNFIREVPVELISQLSLLKSIDLSQNYLTTIPNSMFYNISNIENFDVSSNNLTTFELWLVQIKKLINYSNNRVNCFTNNYNVDFSNYQSNITERILLRNTQTRISFDDSLFEMYNRCQEINSTNNRVLMKAIKTIHDNNKGLLNWNCSCEQYYLQEYIVSIDSTNNFSTWACAQDPSTNYGQRCNYQSSFNSANSNPRLCKIKPDPSSDLESISLEIYNQLLRFNQSNITTVDEFAALIDQSNDRLNQISNQPVTESIQKNFQKIISYIERYLESINKKENTSKNSVGILSLLKTNNSIYSYSQINQNNSLLYYSTEINNTNSIASITIDPISIENLSRTDIYTFYYLPSIFFRYAQKDQNIIIASPVVGLHIPNNSPRSINMSFIDNKLSSGKYFCVFWQYDQWNDTGCSYSLDSNLNRHYCFCNHTTSFALIFIPHKTLRDTLIPSIIIAILSIVCFSISIVLSIHRQAKSFHHLSIANIFSLSNSIILFILLTIILIRSYKSSNIELIVQDKCSLHSRNLAIATYFFFILTFASKTLLGIGYFLTIIFHFIFIEFTIISNKWFYASFFLIILISLIPTIIINIVINRWTNLFLQYKDICWFNKSFIFRFISIPIIIFLALNVLIIIGITIRLIQFFIGRKMSQTNQKRMIVSIMIWITLCISLGIAWIFGPFLDLMIKEKTQTSSKITQWIFGLFNGLEGVWVLGVNVIFYLNQKLNMKYHGTVLNKVKN
ncbi:unnamed protein product [Rotaria sordida]|uniref:Uncharacterized protein n=1 Tax=Rotaria sordida TaxID=392033 RepID=A0A818W1J9_9BILA|nr:unnamed protein product [Rotaria sordida]